jgi:hypothetical protein
LYSIETGAVTATVEFTVNPAPNAAFVFQLLGSGSSYSTRRLVLRRVPGSDALEALPTGGGVACGALASGVPTAVTLAFDGIARTFDVLIAGAPSACMDLPTMLKGPIKGFSLIDAGDEGYGGRIEFTNLALF